jgi:ubiquitin-protein ligase E3 C
VLLFLAELLFFANPGVAADAAAVARACASFSGGESHASKRDEMGKDDQREEEFSERATWRNLLLDSRDAAAESARATAVASRLVAFALAALGEHDESALDAEAAGALARAVIALTESPSVSRRALFSRKNKSIGGEFSVVVRSAGRARGKDAAEALRSASISRRRCVATARLLDVLWTRVVGLAGEDARLRASNQDASAIGIGIESDGDATSDCEKQFAAQLISLPRVWLRGGDPATTWASVVATLFAMTRKASVGSSGVSSGVSFPDPPVSEDRRRGHSGYADAWALGNLVEGASLGLASSGSRRDKWLAATRFAEAAASLVRRLPPGTTLSRLEKSDAETDDGERVDDVAPMDAEEEPLVASASSESDASDSASDDDDDEGFRSTAARRRRHTPLGSTGSKGSAFPLAFRSVHPDSRAQIVSALDPGFLKMLVDACLVDEEKSGFAFAVPADSSAAGDPDVPSTAAAANEAGVRAVSAFVAALVARLGSADRGALMSSLAFGTPFIARAWRTFSGFCEKRRWPNETIFASQKKSAFGSRGARTSASSSTHTPSPNARWMTALGVFASAYGTFLLTGDDEEFAKRGKPLPATETPALVAALRDALWHALWVESSADANDDVLDETFDDEAKIDAFESSCRCSAFTTRSLARALAQVHDRNGRLGLVDPSLFHAPELFGSGAAAADGFLAEAAADLGSLGSSSGATYRAGRKKRRGRAAELLRRGPALVPFDARVRWFAAGIARDRAESVGSRGNGAADFLGLNSEHHVTVTRGRVFDDAMAQLGTAVFASDAAAFRVANPGVRPPGSLKGTVRVNFRNAHGVEEPGVDGGGLFKDFLGALVAEAFDVKRGLFAETPERTLYPNPASELLCGPDHLRRLEFLGAVLGKAVYEGILVDVPLAGFFLAKLRDGRPPELNDLATLDREMYRHLLSLKTLDAHEVDALGLDFTATDQSSYGVTDHGNAHDVVELVPGGGDVPVTAVNRGRYVHLMAHHLLHRQIKRQSAAFVRGFRSLIAPESLRVFAPAELRLLISGAGGGLNVADLAACTVYSGGYSPEHPTIKMLWRILETFSRDEQRAFLRFVTACPNTPLLGFKQLAPSFCVHRAGMGSGSDAPETSADTNRLPTAATCMNMLKLPPYADLQHAREKLLIAINSESGFDLS